MLNISSDSNSNFLDDEQRTHRMDAFNTRTTLYERTKRNDIGGALDSIHYDVGRLPAFFFRHTNRTVQHYERSQ